MESEPIAGDRCRRPPPLSDLDLIAAADGEARADILAHIASCDHCEARSRALTALQGFLRSRLYRAFCPPTQDLVAYQHGMLPLSRSDALGAHIAECPHCAAEMRALAAAVEGPHPYPELPRLVRRIVAQPVALQRAGGLAALYGTARSGPSAAQYAYRADNLELTLRVERVAGRSGGLVISGSLSTEDRELAVLLTDASACLLHEQSVLAVTPLDELGTFLFDGVSPGEYRLSLLLGACEVVVESLAL